MAIPQVLIDGTADPVGLLTAIVEAKKARRAWLARRNLADTLGGSGKAAEEMHDREEEKLREDYSAKRLRALGLCALEIDR